MLKHVMQMTVLFIRFSVKVPESETFIPLMMHNGHNECRHSDVQYQASTPFFFRSTCQWHLLIFEGAGWWMLLP